MLRKAHVNGFDVASLRVGQVCGSEASGAWNVTDWVPILVKSSLTMGNFPDLDEVRIYLVYFVNCADSPLAYYVDTG